MTTDTDKLMAKAEKARFAYEAAKEKAECQAQAETQRKEAIEQEWFDAREAEYDTLPEAISAARDEFIEAARSGDLSAAFAAWRRWQRTWSERAAWAGLLHHRIYGPNGQRKEGDGIRHTGRPIVRQRHGLGDFGKDLSEALHQVVNDDAAAYVRERTADLRAALKG